MKPWITASLSGLLFAAGLLVSGIVRPSRVLGFLDFAGDWDPTLAFVMVGGIGVHAALRRRVLRQARPIFEGKFHLPTRSDLDVDLIAGAVMFGIGWGLVGYCPGPALAAAPGAGEALLFVVTMLGGMGLHAAVTWSRQACAGARA